MKFNKSILFYVLIAGLLVVAFYIKDNRVDPKLKDTRQYAEGTYDVYFMSGARGLITLPVTKKCAKICSDKEKLAAQIFAKLCRNNGYQAFDGTCCDSVCTGNSHFPKTN